MTDNEIVKALECCVLYKQICPETCPMVNVLQCKVDLRKNTLDLINRQKDEIERLRDLLKRHQRHTNSIRILTAETTKKIKSEAYKEFAERLKEKKMQSTMDRRICTFEMINNLLKELVGEENV